MAFEIRSRDLLARIGRLETKSGVVETPVLLPVVNPAIQPISPKAMREEFGCTALMTNAYIIKKRFEAKAAETGVHRFLNYDGVIMTDSGAYQTLMYGDVQTTNKEIIQFQESINTDIAVILDVPTGWGVSQQYAKRTVEDTLKRAEELAKVKTRDDILWTGPVQGGAYLDLVAHSAKKMSKLPFQVHALGSPTPVMEQYLFDTLVDMILVAKRNLPPNRPLHLFGAGHPFMFALAIALGCDMFDSAAYALFARQDRYMTNTGTLRLKEIEYFPCSCPMCRRENPAEVKGMPKPKRQRFLAQHNLYVSLAEIKRTKQAIVEGRLWEHLEMQSHAHPALFTALKRLRRYSDLFEAQSPVSKASGLFFYSGVDLARPEVVRHAERLRERYVAPRDAKVLLLLPQTRMKPFHKSREHARVIKEIERRLGDKMGLIHVCTYAAPFGVVPIEIDEVYPLSQYEVALPLDDETITYVNEQVKSYIKMRHYQKVVLLSNRETWGTRIAAAVKRVCKERKVPVTVLSPTRLWNKVGVNSLSEAVEKAVGEQA
ncbi:MAG TPA: tRNA guanosine(15) transglycosylase TgtA [Candidatus Bathyarchaeia archaeon]|nr:tRNA guanosine(15) transglycosylase TgtA [Candidatus Bathyarchaeia archaeon]